jgi:hypothetical protein
VCFQPRPSLITTHRAAADRPRNIEFRRTYQYINWLVCFSLFSHCVIFLFYFFPIALLAQRAEVSQLILSNRVRGASA